MRIAWKCIFQTAGKMFMCLPTIHCRPLIHFCALRWHLKQPLNWPSSSIDHKRDFSCGNSFVVWLVHIWYGGGLTALSWYQDWLSTAQFEGILCHWLSTSWSVRKVGQSSRYDIDSSQPFRWARIYTGHLVTFITWFVWRKIAECTTWSLYQIPHVWCHATLHINDCLYQGVYSTKQTVQPLRW